MDVLFTMPSAHALLDTVRGSSRRARAARDRVDHPDPVRPARLHQLADAPDDAEHQADRDHAAVGLGGALGGRRGRRRGPRRAPGGGRVPAPSRPVREARGARPARRAPVWAARHGEDASGQGDRPRVGRDVLLPERLGVRRDVRRRRRCPHPAPVLDGAEEPARDHLHRRARRRRRPALGRAVVPGAQPDAEPASRRAGRVRREPPARGDRRVEPAPGSRSRAPSPRPFRPARGRGAARPARPRADPGRAHAREAARLERRPARGRPPHVGADGRRPCEPGERGGDLRRPVGARRRSRTPTSTTRSTASSRASSSAS